MQATPTTWQMIFDAMNDSVCLLDSQGRILQSNAATERLLGTPADDILGRTCWEMMHGTSEPPPDCAVMRMLQIGQRQTEEMAVGGIWVKVVADPLLNSAGNATGAVRILSNITERKKLQQSLEYEKHKLTNYFENLPLMAYNISFDGKIVD